MFVIAGGTLYALDRATGRTLWRRAVDAAADKLAYDGGRLYAISGRYLAHALDPATGEALWTVRVAEPTMFAADIVAAGGRLYALDDGYGTYLSAFDGATGTRAFRVAAGNTYDAPAIDAARAYVGDGRIEYAHGLGDGKRVWTSQGDTYGDGDGTAAVHAGRLWTNRGQVLDAATGAKLRDYRSSQIPAFGDGLALLADAGALVAVDEATGAQRWVRPRRRRRGLAAAGRREHGLRGLRVRAPGQRRPRDRTALGRDPLDGSGSVTSARPAMAWRPARDAGRARAPRRQRLRRRARRPAAGPAGAARAAVRGRCAAAPTTTRARTSRTPRTRGAWPRAGRRRRCASAGRPSWWSRGAR